MHALETILVQTSSGITEMASFSFTGQRQNIWHRLGQQFDGQLMTAEQAMAHANMDRNLRVVDLSVDGVDHWATKRPQALVLEGKVGVTPDGDLYEIPEKIVGLAGEQAVAGHESMTMLDRFLLAEEAIHASNGAAVWSTAGLLRDGTQAFACMEAPPIIVDPFGIRDVIQSYLTLKWAFDGSIVGIGELGSSNVRVVCANTLAAHTATATTLIKVKATSGGYDRFKLAAQHWAMAQDEAKALALQGERMMAKANGKQILKGLCEEVLGLKVDADMPKRQQTLRQNKLDEIKVLYNAPTNLPAVGDNGYAAFQTVVEYLDWFSPVKGDDPTTERVANQFDGVATKLKRQAADFVLAYA